MLAVKPHEQALEFFGGPPQGSVEHSEGPLGCPAALQEASMVSSLNTFRPIFDTLSVRLPLALLPVFALELAPSEGPSISNEVR